MMISQLDLPRRLDRPAGKPILTWLLPAAATLVLHAGVLALLVANWRPAHPAHPAAPSEALLQTRVITMTMLAPPSSRANDVTVAPPLPVTPPPDLPVPPPPVQPVQQKTVSAKPQTDHAAMARKVQQAEEQKQQEITRRKQEEALQAERQAALLAAHLQNQEAERARQAMAEAAMAAATAKAKAEAEAEATAAASRQYLPISKQAPAYPRRALDQRKEGDCTVEYTVTAEGTVSEPKLVEGACDDPVFARPSLTAASSFRYQPRMIEGKAVAVPGVRNTFRYRIE